MNNLVPLDSIKEYLNQKYQVNDELGVFVRGVDKALKYLEVKSTDLSPLIWDEKCTDYGLDSNILGCVSIKEYSIVRFQSFSITLYEEWKSMSYEEIAKDIIKRSKIVLDLETQRKVEKLQRSLKFLTGENHE